MSLEQLILLLVLVGLPLYRALTRRGGEQGEAPGLAQADDATEPETTPARLERRLRAAKPIGRRALATVAPPVVERRVTQTSGARTATGSETAREVRAMLRGGRANVGRAVALMAIVGPPRALDPPGTFSMCRRD